MGVLSRFITNGTELAGLLCFAASTIACLIAAGRSEMREARTWTVLALINFLFLIEIYSSFRFRITEFTITVLKANGLYTQLHGRSQEIVIVSIVIVALLVLTASLLCRRAIRAAVRVATSLTIALVALFAIETISLHALDAIFYRPLGPVLIIGWAWVALATGICLAAIQRSRHVTVKR